MKDNYGIALRFNMVVMLKIIKDGALDYCQAPFGSWGHEDPFCSIRARGPLLVRWCIYESVITGYYFIKITEQIKSNNYIC